MAVATEQEIKDVSRLFSDEISFNRFYQYRKSFYFT
jgi:hypothetical protein